ncbi:MAG: hypothetical protein ABSF28_12255 [Terracidiphilus sp.]|jgi:hypothetical protein
MPDQWKPITGLDELEKPSAPPVKRPEFARAESMQSAAATSCQICLNQLPLEFYKLNGRSVCPDCAAKAQAGQAGDEHAAFVQGLAYGAGAAFVGLVLYAGFTIATHFYLGYVAVAVGWFIGKAMMKGSNGVGGRRYQIAAVVLTYGAISLAAIPIMIVEIAPAQDVDWLGKLPQLVFWGIFSPFIEVTGGLSGVIGLIILFAGIRFAWRVTAAKRLVVAGPYYL